MPVAHAALANHVIENDRRKAERAEVALETLMCDREGHTFGTRILNLSLTGMMASTEAPLCERDPIRIDLPIIGWVKADIMWVLGDRVGARFRTPIEESELSMFQRVFGY